MNLNGNLLGRLMTELPGLAGAIQPANGVAQSPGELAHRQHRQNLANAMLLAAFGVLAPSPNRHPLRPLQRLGAGLGAVQGGVGDGARGGILDGLGMEGRGLRPRTGAGLKRTTPARAAFAAAAPEAAAALEAAGAQQLEPARPAAHPRRRSAGRATAPHRKAGGPTLRKFSGTLGPRLDHPAVLPGGWQLYAYEKESGRPVYVGPGRELRIYA
jgi:hypothetical protein